MAKNFIQKLVTLLLVLLVAANVPAVAQNDNARCSITPETSISDALAELQKDTPALCRKARKNYTDLTKEVQERFVSQRIGSGWEKVATRSSHFLAQSLLESMSTFSLIPCDIQAEYETLIHQLKSAAADWYGPLWSKDQWNIASNRPAMRAGIPWVRMVGVATSDGDTPGACVNKKLNSQKCGTRYKQIGPLIDHILVMHDVVDAYLSDVRDRLASDTSRNNKKWQSYFDDLQFQYPLELIANYYFDRKFRGHQPKDEYNNPIGLRQPPGGRWILLHPDVGLSYFDDEPGGERYRASFMLQWVGYQWAGYGDDGRVKWPFGFSVVSTYSDTIDVKGTGLGLMLLYGQYGLALTDNHGDLGITINFSLLRTFKNNESPLALRLKEQIPLSFD